jgi:tRNA(Ile)-lysidine synthase
LSFRRTDLAGYLAAINVTHRHDATNADPAVATRNRLRNVLLPLLRAQINPRVDDAMLRLAQQAADADDAIRGMGESLLDGALVRMDANNMALDISALVDAAEATRRAALIAALDRLNVGMRQVGEERIAAIAGLVAGDDRRRVIELPGGVTVERRGAQLVICRWSEASVEDVGACVANQLPPAESAHSSAEAAAVCR